METLFALLFFYGLYRFIKFLMKKIYGRYLDWKYWLSERKLRNKRSEEEKYKEKMREKEKKIDRLNDHIRLMNKYRDTRGDIDKELGKYEREERKSIKDIFKDFGKWF